MDGLKEGMEMDKTMDRIDKLVTHYQAEMVRCYTERDTRKRGTVEYRILSARIGLLADFLVELDRVRA